MKRRNYVLVTTHQRSPKESIHFLHNETSLGVCFRVVVLQYLHQCGCRFQGCLSVFIITHLSGVSFRVSLVSVSGLWQCPEL